MDSTKLVIAPKMLICAGFLLVVLAVTGYAQTADELSAIKQLGSGFIVYAKDEVIYRADFGPTGYKVTRIADKGVAPTLSKDGKLVAYVLYNTNMGDLCVMNSDGTDKRKVTTAAQKHLSIPNFANDSRLIYTAGANSVRAYKQNYGYFPQEVWLTDLSGNTRKVMTGSGSDSYSYFNELDCHDNWVAWRWLAKSYAAQYNGTANQLANKKDFGQRCGLSFSPDGAEITVNDIPHTRIAIHKRTGTTWASATTVTTGPSKHEHIRWSNRPEWIVANREDADMDLYAFNRETGKRIRLTFEDGRTWWGNLFLGSPTAATQPVRHNSSLSANQVKTSKTLTLSTRQLQGDLCMSLIGQRLAIRRSTSAIMMLPAKKQ